MKYLKKFENHTEYEEARQNLILPNVSLCVSENEVHYNPIVPPETRLIARYNVTSTSEPTSLFNTYSSYDSIFSKMWIDEVEQSNIIATYTFETLGEHEVKFEFFNNVSSPGFARFCVSKLISVKIPSNITDTGDMGFQNDSNLTSVTISEGVSTIGYQGFSGCEGLRSITLPKSITYIKEHAFASCPNLTSITIKAETPPTIGSSGFLNYSDNCIIYVPSASVNAYKEAWTNYASRIQAIPTI